MRKLFSTLLCGVMLFGFFACEEPIHREDQTDDSTQITPQDSTTNDSTSTDSTSTTFTITLLVNDERMGSVAGAGTYDSGDEVTITATANNGYEFVYWSDEVTTNPRELVISQDTTFTAIFEELNSGSNGTHNGHDYIDLSLPSGTLWATCNVGATSPEQYGDYFAWGETYSKETYDWSTYKYGSDYDKLTKYCTNINYGGIDNKTVLDASDDAATVNWGGVWRMPTLEELEELVDMCTWTWASNYNGTGAKGYIVSSNAKGNTNSIFLPTVGRYGSSIYVAGSYGYYWSSSLGGGTPSNPHCAYFLGFGYDFHGCSYYSGGRYHGLSVRPVCSPQ